MSSSSKTSLDNFCEKLPTEIVYHIYEFGPHHRKLMKKTLVIIEMLQMSYLCLGQERFRRNIQEIESKYKKTISVRRLHRFALELTVYNRRVYRLYIDTDFPFSCPSIQFMKHLDEGENPVQERARVNQLWNPSSNLATLILQYDHYNYEYKMR
uniref:Uncharacterized protein n=1 Tax=viral metagenome TaxID=1070528 RepID=A0A6C0D2S7_9ZZZZ